MYKPPRWYYRGDSTQHTFEEYNELSQKPLDTMEERQAMLNIIKRIFVAYWKFLKDLLKEKNIIEYYPRKILLRAVQEGLITETELIWVDYIDMLNKILYDSTEDKLVISKEIITKYTPRIKSINYFIQQMCKNVKKDTYSLEELILPYNKPEYTADSILMPQYAYERLITFLANIPDIKYGWVHGSRAVGDAKPNSDIDLLIDCPLAQFDMIHAQINKLRIPYRIDLSCIYDDSKTDFIHRTSKFAKIIYRKEDFINN